MADGKTPNRKALERRERETAREILAAFKKSYARVEKSFDLLLFEISTARRRGETIAPGKFAERVRLQKVLSELSAEIGDLSEKLGDITTQGQRFAVDAGVTEGEKALEVLELEGTLAGLDAQAARNLVGVGGNGDPLSKLFARLEPLAVESVKDALITGSIAGSSASAIAREIKTALGSTAGRALTIARTEINRSYREASRQFYQANKELVGGYIWTSPLDLGVCPICWALHGRVFPTSEKFATHPNCRCTLTPYFPGEAKPKSGVERFKELTEAQQKTILGSSRFAHYQTGAIELDEFVGVKNTEFGKARYLRPIGEIDELAASRNFAPRVKATPVAKKAKAAATTLGRETTPALNFKTYRDAEAYLETKYPGKTYDLAGCDPKALNPTIEALDKLASEYPEVVDRLKYFGTYKTKSKLVPYSSRVAPSGFGYVAPGKTGLSRRMHAFMQSNANAHATQDGLRIALNPKVYAKVENIFQDFERSAATGFKSKYRVGRAESTFVHEFGHQIDNFMREFSTHSLTGYSRLDGRGEFADIYRKHRAKYRATKDGVSGYALENDAEGFAEMFLETKIAPRETWSPEVKGFNNLLEKFKKYRGQMVESSKTKTFRDISDQGERDRELERLKKIYKDFGVDYGD